MLALESAPLRSSCPDVNKDTVQLQDRGTVRNWFADQLCTPSHLRARVSLWLRRQQQLHTARSQFNPQRHQRSNTSSHWNKFNARCASGKGPQIEAPTLKSRSGIWATANWGRPHSHPVRCVLATPYLHCLQGKSFSYWAGVSPYLRLSKEKVLIFCDFKSTVTLASSREVHKYSSTICQAKIKICQWISKISQKSKVKNILPFHAV